MTADCAKYAAEVRELVAIMRGYGVTKLRAGSIEIHLGPEPTPIPVAPTTPAPPLAEVPRKPNPIGPTGRPMTDEEMVLYAHVLGEPEDDEPEAAE